MNVTWLREQAEADLRSAPDEDARARAEAVARIIAQYERQAGRAAVNALEEDRAWTLERVMLLLAEGYRFREGAERPGGVENVFE